MFPRALLILTYFASALRGYLMHEWGSWTALGCPWPSIPLDYTVHSALASTALDELIGTIVSFLFAVSSTVFNSATSAYIVAISFLGFVTMMLFEDS